jgi:DNA-binding transcriptional MocR family regulator
MPVPFRNHVRLDFGQNSPAKSTLAPRGIHVDGFHCGVRRRAPSIRYEERACRRLSVQLQQMRQALERSLPEGCRLTRPEGGYMLWIELPATVDALRLHQLALDQSISIAPGPIFSAQRRYTNFIRVNFGHPWSKQIDDAVQTLGALTAELMSTSS